MMGQGQRHRRHVHGSDQSHAQHDPVCTHLVDMPAVLQHLGHHCMHNGRNYYAQREQQPERLALRACTQCAGGCAMSRMLCCHVMHSSSHKLTQLERAHLAGSSRAVAGSGLDRVCPIELAPNPPAPETAP